jgi:hypothetical protein
MQKTQVNLGHGITRNDCPPAADTFDADFFLDVIRRLGIDIKDIKKTKTSEYDLLEIYSELRHFGFSKDST